MWNVAILTILVENQYQAVPVSFISLSLQIILSTKIQSIKYKTKFTKCKLQNTNTEIQQQKYKKYKNINMRQPRWPYLSYLYLWKSFCPRSEVHQIPAAPISFHTALISDSTHFYSFLLIFTQNLLSITHFYLFQILLISTHFRLFLVLLSSTFQISTQFHTDLFLHCPFSDSTLPVPLISGKLYSLTL